MEEAVGSNPTWSIFSLLLYYNCDINYMSTVFDGILVDFFSYDSVISKIIDSGWSPKKPPNILLSKIKSLHSDIISEFENMSIYDLDDLENSEIILREQRSGYLKNFEKIRKEAIQTSVKINNIPIVTIELPKNYATISLIHQKNSFDLGMSWKGLLFSWKSILVRNIQTFMKDFNELLVYCNNPDLITDIRTWNFTIFEGIDPTDISVYISNYDVFRSLDEYCQILDQPKYKKNIITNKLLNQIYSIEFILWYAHKIRSDIS